MLNNGTLQNCVMERESGSVVRNCEESEGFIGDQILKPNSRLDRRYTGDRRYEPALSHLTFLYMKSFQVYNLTAGSRPTIREWNPAFRRLAVVWAPNAQRCGSLRIWTSNSPIQC
ncbi:hypothetical protein HAX54_003061, partial [Datura stramonium]|nr:hypothetical protein [Datura stramonium]